MKVIVIAIILHREIARIFLATSRRNLLGYTMDFNAFYRITIRISLYWMILAVSAIWGAILLMPLHLFELLTEQNCSIVMRMTDLVLTFYQWRMMVDFSKETRLMIYMYSLSSLMTLQVITTMKTTRSKSSFSVMIIHVVFQYSYNCNRTVLQITIDIIYVILSSTLSYYHHGWIAMLTLIPCWHNTRFLPALTDQ